MKFKMTPEQLQKLKDACKPVPYMVIGGVEPTSPQENANRAWRNLGDEMGFLWETVQPTGGDMHEFEAMPLNNGMKNV